MHAPHARWDPKLVDDMESAKQRAAEQAGPRQMEHVRDSDVHGLAVWH